MADSTVLVLALFFVFAADVFLYYRWKGVREEYEERQRAKKVDFAKEHLSRWDKNADGLEIQTAYSKNIPPYGDTAMVDEAKNAREELQSILDGDVASLHGRVSGVNDKLSPS
ncbi:MAG TPA: hypothetical protein VJI71_01920 [Candidatus Norongarragalinales archaeon]|nr:hypothetical protein [Candidatus Norongarragalinales archaeon]